MNAFGLPLRTGWVLVGLAVVAGVLAALLRGTALGALLWFPVVMISASGYGAMLGRVARHRVGLALRCVSGLAVLLVIATVAAHVGVLTYSVQLALVVVGLLFCAVVTEDIDVLRDWPREGVTLLAIGVIVLLLVLGITDTPPPVADGANHVFAVKQLRDIGTFAKLHHQLGAQIVAESLFSLIGGPAFAGAFEGELCAALLLLLLASELRPGPYRIRELTLLVVAIAISLDVFADDEARWSGVLLVVAAFLALRAAVRDRRLGWHAVAIAAALAALRHEYMLIAVPHLVAALVIPKRVDRPQARVTAMALAGWAVFLVAFQVPLAVKVPDAVVNAVWVSLVGAGAWWLSCALIRARWDDAVGVTIFSAITSFFAVWIGAVRPAQHGDSATFAVGFGLALCLLIHFAYESEREDCGAITRAVSTVALGVFTVAMLLDPSFQDHRRNELIERFRVAITVLRDFNLRGVDLDAARDVRELQGMAPAGVSIGFWGVSADAIDFARNRVVDIGWAVKSARRRRHFLVPITPQVLKKLDYVIVEDLAPPPVFDPWAPARSTTRASRFRHPSPTEAVESQLEPVAVAGAARLYRVRAAR